jgi:hypothetical protein
MSESTAAVQGKWKQRRTLLVLVAVFFAPLAAAFILYYGVGWRPAGGSNHGELLDPIKSLPPDAAPLAGKWALVYVGSGACAEETCRHALWMARQTRLALNQEMDRVNRALLAVENCCDLAFLDQEHKGIRVFDVSAPELRAELLGLLPAGDPSPYLFIVDPRGNIVMRYDTRKEPRGLLDDMKKLLKLSHIG